MYVCMYCTDILYYQACSQGGGFIGFGRTPLKKHQTIKNKCKSVLKEYMALLRPTRHFFLSFRCSNITKRYPEHYLITIGLHFVMMSFTIRVTFCTTYVFCNSFTLWIILRAFCIGDQCIMCVCVCVCVWVGARACMHVKGDCRHLKCNPPMEIPGYGPDYAQYVHKHIRYMLLTAMVK